MANVLHALLDNVTKSSERAAITAGWEIGVDLGGRLSSDDMIRKEVDKAVRLV